MILKQVELIWKPEVQDYCKMPYPAHPEGCPMYGTRDSCPPQSPLINEVIDLERPVYAAVLEYDLKKHTEDLRAYHPNWSEAQLRNPRYWQNTARKELRDEIESEKVNNSSLRNLLVLYRPEANGVHLVSTLRKVGIKIVFPPKDVVHIVAILGSRKAGKLRRVFE